MYFVYVIYSEKLDKYYIGFTADIQDRLANHNRKSNGFSNRGRPWVLVYSEPFNSKKEAMQREKQLKNWKNRQRLESYSQLAQSIPTDKSGGSGVRLPHRPKNHNRKISLMYFVYVIYSQKNDKYYIGFTADINDRLVKYNRKS
jgi:putative endonuclease